MGSKSIAEKLGIVPGKDGWDELKCKMLVALIGYIDIVESLCYEYDIDKSAPQMQELRDHKATLKEATGLSWEETRELLS